MAQTKKNNFLPVSPVYIGDRPALEMDLSIISYNPDEAHMNHLSGVDELAQYKSDSKISWINISGLKDIAAIKKLGELYNIHPLTVEDVLHTEQQPKIELFDTYRFLSVKTIQRETNYHETHRKPLAFFAKNKKAAQQTGKQNAVLTRARGTPPPNKSKEQNRETDEFLIDQVSIIIMKNTLITFQEIPGDSFNGVRKRILENAGEIRKTGTDYLAYAIIDAIVDEYFITLNHLEEDIENFEDHATKTSDETFIEKIQDTRYYLLQIKRAVLPLKDNIIAIIRHENFFETDELKPFLQDLSENLNNAIITVENHREWLTNIMDVNISVLSYQMNKVMKVLATISTIFIPLTFIAGIYGMNFTFMPETQYRFGYPVVLGGMGIIALVMIIIFKIRRWF